MARIAATEARRRFGALIDRVRREPVELPRYGRPVAGVVSPRHFIEFADLPTRRAAAVRTCSEWWGRHPGGVAGVPDLAEPAASPTDPEIDRLVHEIRQGMVRHTPEGAR